MKIFALGDLHLAGSANKTMSIFGENWKDHDKKIKQNEFIFWSIIWTAIIIVALIPSITSIFAKPFGIGRGTDFVVYIRLIALFYLLFRLYVKAEKIERNITRLVRTIAIRLK